MKKIFDNMATIFVLCAVFLIIIPLKPSFLDVMLILNISISMIILLTTMYVKQPLEFSVFPSILLITTLLRVSLSVSSTRLILGNGGEAGKVIKTFGDFVIGGSPVVGFIVFLIIVIVQFIVITKGSERVAEVAARFTLDAMPGKQMAIDADLNAGLITDEEARARRRNIQREADFYGAMDGATKFVKGDAIVSILVVFINSIGGTVIGLVMGGKTFTEVLSIYITATVGDGLVTQLPALMISVATGMTVTRAASDSSLSKDLQKQLISYPVVLVMAGGVLLLLCLIPGFPVFQLFLIGGLLIFFGRQFMKKRETVAETEEEDLPISETEFYKNPENIYSLLTVEQIEMEFGYSLIPLVDESKGSSFIDRIVVLRRQFASNTGIVLPSVRLRDNIELNPNQYLIKIKGEEIVRGEVLADHYLAMNPLEGGEEIEGIDTIEPAFGIPAKWITPDKRELAHMAGYTIIDPLSVIITHLSEVVKKHAHELLGRKEVAMLLDNLKKTNKELIDDVIPAIISLSELHKILANLLYEQIPIKDLQTILETAAEYAPTVKDSDMLTEYVRQALRRTITRKFAVDGKLKVITLHPDLENELMNHVKKTTHGSYVSLEPAVMQQIVTAHSKEVDRIRDLVSEPIILTSPVVRFYYKRLIEQFAPDTVVLSFNEIEANVNIQALGTIKTEPEQDGFQKWEPEPGYGA